MKTCIVAIAVVLSTVAFAGGGQNGQAYNGSQYNGGGSNGIQINGPQYNSRSYNGLRQNGGANNGNKLNHIEPNGTALTSHKVEVGDGKAAEGPTGVKARNATARGGRLFIR